MPPSNFPNRDTPHTPQHPRQKQNQEALTDPLPLERAVMIFKRSSMLVSCYLCRVGRLLTRVSYQSLRFSIIFLGSGRLRGHFGILYFG